jgi:ABC-type sugar transport system substrate-binding protein
VPKCKYVLGWSFPDLNIPFFIAQHYGITAECKAIGVECIILNAGGYDRPENQVSNMEDLIQRKVHAILIDPADDKALKEVMNKAERAGIPVISWSAPSSTELIHANNGTDHYNVGLIMAPEVMRALGPDGGTLIMVHGVKGASWQIGRETGLWDELKKRGYADKVKVLAQQYTDSSRAGAQKAFEDMFLANPNPEAIWVCCDQPALGIADVLERGGKAKGRIPIVTGGWSPLEVEKRIRDGTIFSSVVQQPVLDAIQATRMAVKLLNGEPIPFFIESPVVVVTKDNIDKVDKSLFEALETYRVR